MSLWDLLGNNWQQSMPWAQDLLSPIETGIEDFDFVNPTKENVFRALSHSPSNFRVVILGQDPYPDPSLATGLAFSVPENSKTIPPTLQNIQKEFESDLGKSLGNDLSHWTEAGVLLLNRILTCKKGISLSHKDLGWQEITTGIVQQVLRLNQDAVGILWGKHAQELEHLFKPELVIKSVHPSPLSAYRGFFGSKPFSRANSLLISTKQESIDWA